MKRKLIVLVLVALFVFSAVLLPGCANKTSNNNNNQQQKKLKVVLYLNGTLGDKSFFDSANRGMQMIEKDFGVEGKTIEGGYDPSKWEPDLEQLSQGDWDIIIVGTWQMASILQKIAPKYPNKKYIIFDTTVDYSKGDLKNVYSILYKQNESSFLAGALAAMITESNMPLANKQKVIGFVGGMNIPVINDFKIGYEQGAHYIDPDIKVLVSYAGSFNNPAKGKELALAQYDQGADIVFNVAGETGIGVLAAAKEKNKYAIGVDSDQYLEFKDKDPEMASHIVTSVMKNVDKSIYRAIKLYREGKLEFGKAEALGLKEDGVGLADDANYEKVVPQQFRDKINELKQDIIDGKIKVKSAFTTGS